MTECGNTKVMRLGTKPGRKVDSSICGGTEKSLVEDTHVIRYSEQLSVLIKRKKSIHHTTRGEEIVPTRYLDLKIDPEGIDGGFGCRGGASEAAVRTSRTRRKLPECRLN